MFSMGIYSNSIWPSSSLSSGQGKVTWDDVIRNSWVSISFFTSIFKKPNCVSLRPEIKEGLIYYLISKYMVTSRCKEKPTHQLQKANSTFLVVRLGIKVFCYQVCAFVWMVWRCYRKCYFFELSNREKWKAFFLDYFIEA